MHFKSIYLFINFQRLNKFQAKSDQWWIWVAWTWENTTNANDLVPMNYGWAGGEPNNQGRVCAELYERGELNDVGCDSSKPFICQLNGYP